MFSCFIPGFIKREPEIYDKETSYKRKVALIHAFSFIIGEDAEFFNSAADIIF